MSPKDGGLASILGQSALDGSTLFAMAHLSGNIGNNGTYI